jgi:hypothetical protein
MEQLAYSLVNPFVMAAGCYAITIANCYQAKQNEFKRWPKRIKGLNWLVMGSVYAVDAIFSPDIDDIRIWFRIASFFVIVGEVAYHGDVFSILASNLLRRFK